MTIEKVDSFCFHPDSKERTRAMRQADPSKTPWTPLKKQGKVDPEAVKKKYRDDERDGVRRSPVP
jgi:hypothetical protein